MPVELPATFGSRLLKLRLLKGYTQPELAARSGLSTATISRYEDDPDANYTKTSLQLLARGLEVDSRYLTGDAVDLVALSPRKVAARQALIRFLDAGTFTARQRARFVRIQDHAAAPVTVQAWMDFWSLVRGFFGQTPVTTDAHDDRTAPLMTQTKREMARAELNAMRPGHRSRSVNRSHEDLSRMGIAAPARSSLRVASTR